MRRLALAAFLLAAWPGPPAAAELLRPSGAAVVRADTVALVFSGQDGGAIPLSVLATAPLAPSRTAVVVADVAGAALIEGHPGPLLMTDVVVYVLGPGNETLAQAARRFVLDLERFGAELARSGLRVAFALEVPPGEHRVRLLVRSENGALGLASASLSAAVRPDGELLPPLLPPPPGRWVTAVSEADEAALTRTWAGLFAQTLPPSTLLPSSHPVLRADSGRDLVLVTTGNGGPVPGAVLEDADGAVAEIPLESPERLSGIPDGMTAWRARLGLAGVGPGSYNLSVASGGMRSPPIPVFVTAGDAAADRVWTEVGTRELEPGVALPLVDESAGAPPLPEREIAAGYLGALRRLAAGDRSAALDGLYGLETGVLSSFESEALELLGRVEAETLASVLEGAWPALLPVALLHAEAAGGYRTTLRSALVGHSEQMVLSLTRAYVERVGGDAARRDASRILAGVAAELRRQGTLARAEWIYRHALEIDPGNEDLVLAVAAIQARWGRYPEAVATLGGQRRHGLGREGRLRLALNLERTGRRAAAERLLSQLVRDAEAGDDWIGVLAVEELARMELERKRPDAASAILRRGLERWPDHRALRLQLAYVLDRLEKSNEATDVLEEIAGRASSRSADERVRYNEWPRPPADSGRREMMARAAEGLAELARALQRLG